MAKRRATTPDPGASPTSGVAPPAEHRWKPGQSGNPNGRPSAGMALQEWLNLFATQQLTEAELRIIARDRSAPWTKRAAAERVVRALESGDLAAFEAWLTGQKSLNDLKASGINTEIVKKAKVRTLKGGGIERELELHDRSGDDFDRIADRTTGRPRQAVEVTGNLPTAIQIVTPLTMGKA